MPPTVYNTAFYFIAYLYLKKKKKTHTVEKMVPVTTNLIPEYFTSLLLGPFYTDGIISKGPSLSNLESVLGLIRSI